MNTTRRTMAIGAFDRAYRCRCEIVTTRRIVQTQEFITSFTRSRWMVATIMLVAILHTAKDAHAQCGEPGEGACCEVNGTPFCDDLDCCNAVCAQDPYCCDTSGGQWDACCVNLAVEVCPEVDGCHIPPVPRACGQPDAGPCCESNQSVGCDHEACCHFVCSQDPFCCDVQWDQLCAEAAQINCGGVCTGGGTTPSPAPPIYSCAGYCGGAAPSGCWCDEACCHFGDCCEDKGQHCVGCQYGMGPAQYYGDWCIDDGCGGTSFSGCGCDEDCFERGDCCSTICLPWECPHLDGCIPPNPADLTGDGAASIADLIALIENWGTCEFERCQVMEHCAGDFNHDGTVNVLDLLFLLQNWG